MIMQENRSFDHYFGTFRGADGIPGLAATGFSAVYSRPAEPDRRVLTSPSMSAATRTSEALTPFLPRKGTWTAESGSAHGM